VKISGKSKREKSLIWEKSQKGFKKPLKVSFQGLTLLTAFLST